MKELSIEEKAKRYDEAIEIAMKFLNKELFAENSEWAIKHIFPELKESEDEKIRKEIITYLSTVDDKELIPYESWIAWLNSLKDKVQSKQDEHDITEPKFKVGDWVIFNNNNNKDSIYRIEKAENYQYTLRHILGGSMPLSCCSENMLRLWTAGDAKEGDVLAASDNSIFIYAKTIDTGCVPYIVLTADGIIKKNRDLLVAWESVMGVRPATKEQRNLLFQKMREVGYTWDSKKKELIRRI